MSSNTPLDDLAREVSKGLGDGPEPQQLAEQRAALIARTSSTMLTRRPSRWPAFALTAVATAAIVVTALLWFGGSPTDEGAPLRGSVGDSDLQEGQFLETEQAESMDLHFSEGSRVVVEAESRARLARLRQNSVDLSIESGSVSSSIVPEQGVQWNFLAGPYRVVVVGTRLRVEWRPDEELLIVDVTEGRVRVGGAHLGDQGITVARGQRFRVAEAEAELAEIPAQTPAAPSASLAEDAGEPLLDASQPRATSPEAQAMNHHVPTSFENESEDWRTHARAGRYRRALEAAEAQGFSSLTESLPDTELLELADAARLAGNSREARQALLALRRRFPGRSTARRAGLRLGRLAATSEGDLAEATRWYENVLRESPRGPLAADARGRLMDVLVQRGQRSEAARVARDYLTHHPQGPYAEAARRLAATSTHDQDETQ